MPIFDNNSIALNKLNTYTAYMDDPQLWNRFRSGDEDAYTLLAGKYYRTLLHYGQKFTRDLQSIEDAIQDLLIHLWLHRQSLGDTASVKFYLLKSLRHRLIRTRRETPEQVLLDESYEHFHTERSTEDFLISSESTDERNNLVRDLLAQLSSRQREVIYLRFYQGLRPDEIAGLLSIHPQSVSNIIQRALVKLREIMPAQQSIPIVFYSFFQII